MMYDNDSLNWLMALCAFCLIILPFIKDPYDRVRKKITWTFIFMVLLVFFGIHLTNEKDKLAGTKDRKIATLQDSLNTTNRLLASLGVDVDSLLKHKPDAIIINKNKGIPQISLKPMSSIQFLSRMDGVGRDTVSLVVPISNTGTAPAYKLESQIFILAEGPNDLQLVGILPDLFNGHEVISEKGGYDLKMGYMQKTPLPERIYFYCTVNFQSDNDKICSPLRDLFVWEQKSPSVVLNPGKNIYQKIRNYIDLLPKDGKEYRTALNTKSTTTEF